MQKMREWKKVFFSSFLKEKEEEAEWKLWKEAEKAKEWKRWENFSKRKMPQWKKRIEAHQRT